MAKLPDKELFRVDEIARYFDVHPKTIRLWIDNGNLEAKKIVGSIRISRNAVIKCQKVREEE